MRYLPSILSMIFLAACSTQFKPEDGDADAEDDLVTDIIEDTGSDVPGDTTIEDTVADTATDPIEEDGPPVYHTLTVDVVGDGTVTSSPAGITCGDDCKEEYESGTEVELTAEAGSTGTFTGWSGGGCSGTGTCVVTLTADTTVSANFTLDSRVLTVNLDGTGSGTVTSDPGGITCGDDCSEAYGDSTTVTLTAMPNDDSTFTGWSGGGCSGTDTCEVTLTTDTTVTATFTLNSHVLTVSRTGTGSGTVSSSPAGIYCGEDCTEAYDESTPVTLAATADEGSTFEGWSGGGCSGTGTCVVTLTSDTTVTATFTARRYLLTVTHAGTGGGTVTSSPAGINCGTDCNEYYDHGTDITLSAVPDDGDMFTGWSGGGCSGTGTCVVTLTSASTVTATFEPRQYNYAFISPVAHNASMGGLGGADAMCNGWAADAGIGGNYRAILSTATVNAATRLGTARGWIRPDGRPVGDLPGEIFDYDQGLLIPIMVTANGTDIGVQSVWSASNNSGTFSSYHTDCGEWTSTSTADTARYGFSNTTTEWLDRGTATACDQELHIYCFQVDHTTPLDMSEFAETGRIIFVSTGDFNTAGSISAADALCSADAATYSALSGKNFQAFLADVGASAASRFASSTGPIVRVDGLRVADSFSALTTMDLIHPPSIKADGSTETWRVFAGASSPTSNGTVTSTCSGWSSTIGNVTEGFAYSSTLLDGARRWFGNTNGTCASHSDTVPVYCLEI